MCYYDNATLKGIQKCLGSYLIKKGGKPNYDILNKNKMGRELSSSWWHKISFGKISSVLGYQISYGGR